jgi:hypothetical protein
LPLSPSFVPSVSLYTAVADFASCQLAAAVWCFRYSM